MTSITADRRRLYQVEANAVLFSSVLQSCRAKKRFELHAHVIMPDHVHLLLTPAHDVSLEKAVQFVKGGFSFLLKSKLDVWQSGYNETQVRTGDKFFACREYIEQNPVMERLVATASNFTYNSASRPDLIDGPPNWCRPDRG